MFQIIGVVTRFKTMIPSQYNYLSCMIKSVQLNCENNEQHSMAFQLDFIYAIK